MAKTTKRMGYKHRLTNPIPGDTSTPLVDWNLRRDGKVLMFRVWNDGEVETPDGPMLLVRLAKFAEFQDPSVDVAVLVGAAKVYRKSGIIDPQAPELWFYDDKFWVKARNLDNSEYYSKAKQSLLYEVQVRDHDKLLLATQTGFELPSPEEQQQ